MSSIHSWLAYALESGDFASLPDEPPIDERDRLRTLIGIYRSPDPALASLATLRSRLESWLKHTLDQRVALTRITSPDEAEAMLRVTARTHKDFYDWLATAADAEQLRNFLAVELGSEASRNLPTSVLYRDALDGLLQHDATLEPERLGSRSMQALTSLPSHPEWARVLRGARWRDDVDARYLRDIHTLLATRELLVV